MRTIDVRGQPSRFMVNIVYAKRTSWARWVYSVVLTKFDFFTLNYFNQVWPKGILGISSGIWDWLLFDELVIVWDDIWSCVLFNDLFQTKRWVFLTVLAGGRHQCWPISLYIVVDMMLICGSDLYIYLLVCWLVIWLSVAKYMLFFIYMSTCYVGVETTASLCQSTDRGNPTKRLWGRVFQSGGRGPV